MEPTSKSMPLGLRTGKDGAGAARAPLAALQSVDFQTQLTAEPGKFLGLLRAEAVRAERAHAQPSRPESPRPGTDSGARVDAERAAEKRSSAPDNRASGSNSPPDDSALPQDADGQQATDGSAGSAAQQQQPESAQGSAPAEEPSAGVNQPTEGKDSAAVQSPVADADAAGHETGQGGADKPWADGVILEQATPEATSAGGETEQAATAAAGIDPAAAVEDANLTAAAADTDSATGEVDPDAVVVPPPGGAGATKANPAGSPDGNAPGHGVERAAERVAANLARNPEAAAEGLQRAQEALQRTVAGSGEVAADAPRPAGTASSRDVQGGAAVALDLRTPDAQTKAVETGTSAARSAETAASATPRPAAGAEMPIQIRMPTVAAAQVEQALAARHQAGDRVDLQSNAKVVATAATAPANATAASPAAAGSEATRAALQQVRASFSRPGWDQAMAQRVAQMAARGVQSAQIEVDPPELGPIKVVIQVNNDQQTSVSFSSPNAGVREALEQTAARLREAMAEAGLDLADVDVSDQSSDEHTAHRDEGESRAGVLRGGLEGTDPEGEAVVAVSVRDSDSLVDHYV